ncbi:MAG: ATP-binding protein [Thermoplasmatota archaeon]
MTTATGRIMTASTRMAYCDLQSGFVEGDLVLVVDGDTRIRARVTALQTGLKGKFVGHIEFLQAINKPPARGALLEKTDAQNEVGGLHLAAGVDGTDRAIRLRLNKLFKHLLLAGKTTSGKTHLGLGIAEQLRAWRVPTLIIDPQNDWVGLDKVFPKDVVVTDDPDKALAALEKRQTAILGIEALAAREQRIAVREVLGPLFKRHESADRRGKPSVPTMIIMDEADRFARKVAEDQEPCLEEIVEVAKRGVKLGLGLVLITQRPNSLHVDVRSQVNSCALFRLDDPTSIGFLRDMGLTNYDLNTVTRLEPGQCLMAGQIVDRPTFVRVAAIQTPRVRSLDFESAIVGAAA